MFKFLALSMLAVPMLMQAQQLPQLGKDPVEKVIGAMTLEEKLNLIIGTGGNVKSDDLAATIGNAASLVPGAAGQTNAIERLGIPPIVLADGPAGLRINATREGTAKTFYATHFPVETVMSATWNADLVRSMGAVVGSEVKHYGVDVLLAPATNIHRNPLNGRNFEYYSEDPLLSGVITAAMVDGVQSNGVGTSVKHFAFNNQETNRTSNDVIASPRTLREIYLRQFEYTVKHSQPWTIMSAYNKVNGTMTSERADLITDILRAEWGFEGMVMTDWFGGINAVNQMLAGNDMLMPGKLSQREELTKAVNNGLLPMYVIDMNVRRILELIMKTPRFKGYVADNNPDLAANAVVARNSATEGMVLLKNVGSVLPLAQGVKKMAVFGFSSYDFIAGGTGSGDVNHAYVVSLIEGLGNAGYTVDEGIRAAYEAYIPVAKAAIPKSDSWLDAFLPKQMIGEMDLAKLDLAAAARANDVAVVTIGKTSGEFADRNINGNFNLTTEEQKMLAEVSAAFRKAGKKVVVILNVTGPIEMKSWQDKADAILVSWLPGQEGGNSVGYLLSGRETPSGRLPMTWPVSYADVPSKADFPTPDDISRDELLEALKGFTDVRHEGGSRKNFDYTEYNDGIYVGYRYYTTKGVAVSYPFGYGLSYTTFKYGAPAVSKDAKGNLTVSVEVKNAGKHSGKEVVQVYVAAPGKDMDKPSRELRGFAKTRTLAPGESQRVSIDIPYESLASFNETDSRWQVEAGTYSVLVARNAADANPLTATVQLEGAVTQSVHPNLAAAIK